MGDRNCLPQVLLYGRALVAVVSRSIRTGADIAGSAILYGEWRRGVSATMRQTHAGGEKLFVDFAGDTVPVIDPFNGDTRQAHIFVAALGASN
jgi:transposase